MHRAWYRVHSLHYVCVQSSGIILIPEATFVPNFISVEASSADLAHGQKLRAHPAYLKPWEPKLVLRNKYDNRNGLPSLQYSSNDRIRRNDTKLVKNHVRYDIRKRTFTHQIVNLWNSLPIWCMLHRQTITKINLNHTGLTKKWCIIMEQKFQEPEAAVFYNKLQKLHFSFVCHLDWA